MKSVFFYIAWAVMYALCVGLGTADSPEGVGKVLFVLTGLIFFLPPAWLLYDGKKNGRKKQVLVVRICAIVSLALTLCLLVANFLSVNASAQVGQRLYELLILVSAPMICIQYWVLSLFLWACLMWSSFHKPKK